MPKTAMICPGQGAQKVGMGKELCLHSAAARDVFDRASRALGFDITKMCFDGPAEELSKTDIAQPAILTVTMASIAAMKERGEIKTNKIAFSAGLSLGEYSALCFAGAIELEDAVRLVRNRGKYMQQACDEQPGAMISLMGADVEKAQRICDQSTESGCISIANLNCPGQVVISGEVATIDEAEKIAAEFGVKRAIRLKVAGAFHSALMQGAGDKLARDLAQVEFKTPRIPTLANVTGELHPDSADGIGENLRKQVSGSVYWEKCVRWILAQGITNFVEPAPGSVLSGMMKKIEASAVVTAGPA